MFEKGHIVTIKSIALLSLSILMLPMAAFADEARVLVADRSGNPIEIDGAAGDWANIPAIKVPLEGRSKVDEVELRAAIRGNHVYVLAIWPDKKPNDLHKPLKWDDASQSYKKMRSKEDRFAISWLMSGEFSEDKTSGSEFEADVWHWKAER